MSKTIVSSDGQAPSKKRRKSAVKNPLPRFEHQTEHEAPVPVTALAESFGYKSLTALSTAAWGLPAEPTGYQVAIEPQKRTKKIAIVGKAPSTIADAPYNDPEWEIWGLSDLILHKACVRWSRWFELHDPEGWHPDDACPRRQKWHPKYWEFLTADHQGKPIYLRAPHPEIKSGVIFPHQKLIDRFCIKDKHGRRQAYFTNTVSWMLAMALDEGATHISVFGVDMAQQEKGVKSEYAFQRPSCEYFIGVAHGMGVEVYIPENSDLMKAGRLYAIDSLSPGMRSAHKKRLNDLQKMRQQNDQEVAQLEHQLREKKERRLVLIGAEDDTRQWWGQQVL